MDLRMLPLLLISKGLKSPRILFQNLSKKKRGGGRRLTETYAICYFEHVVLL